MSEFGDIYDVLVEYILDRYRMEIDRLVFPSLYKGGEEDVKTEGSGGAQENKQAGNRKHRNHSNDDSYKKRTTKRIFTTGG